MLHYLDELSFHNRHASLLFNELFDVSTYFTLVNTNSGFYNVLTAYYSLWTCTKKYLTIVTKFFTFGALDKYFARFVKIFHTNLRFRITSD